MIGYMLRTAFALLLLFGLSQLHAQTPLPVILDTDIGDDIDDALALALALQSPELKILAITTVLQDGERRADLTWKILDLYGRKNIPIGIGAEQTLLGATNKNVIVQGKALTPQDHQPAAERRNGVQLLIDTCLKTPGKVTLLAYGPLTNVALALRSEPRIKEKLDRIVLMNGYFFKPGLEYNTYTDSEASQIVYSSGVPIQSVGLDVTLQCKLSAADLERMDSSPLPNVKFLMQLIHLWQGANNKQRPTLHDPLAIGMTIRPSLIHLETGQVEVELKGEKGKTYGMTLFHADPKGTTKVASQVEASSFIQLFLERVVQKPRESK
jgi:purine nucleosidase